MENNDLSVEKIKEEIKKLKIEILEKEDKLDELLDIVNSDNNKDIIDYED